MLLSVAVLYFFQLKSLTTGRTEGLSDGTLLCQRSSTTDDVGCEFVDLYLEIFLKMASSKHYHWHVQAVAFYTLIMS